MEERRSGGCTRWSRDGTFSMLEVNARWTGLECFGIALDKLYLAEMTFHLRFNEWQLNSDVIN